MNPVAAAFQLTGRTAVLGPDNNSQSNDPAAERKFEVRLRAIRPVSLAPGWLGESSRSAAEIAFTSADSWNTFQPYPQDRAGALVRALRRPPPPTSTSRRRAPATRSRRGPFPIAVAVENKIPASWVNEDYEQPGGRRGGARAVRRHVRRRADGRRRQARTAHAAEGGGGGCGSCSAAGSVFAAARLDPPEEKLLLHSVNWLTNREDRLPRSATEQTPECAPTPPRVAMSDRDRELWSKAQWSACRSSSRDWACSSCCSGGCGDFAGSGGPHGVVLDRESVDGVTRLRFL